MKSDDAVIRVNRMCELESAHTRLILENMKQRAYFGYLRVSHSKQKTGVSLKEQRSDIKRFAQSRGLEIREWFTEVRTAAKAGRPVFVDMLARLRKGEADGLIMHKVDRSARNLEDWLDTVKLVESGIDVQFAYEPIDLHTTGGRFSADILAVSAAHYIRNLRDEARKGFYGRLRQGIYPLPAPVGYLNRGKGKPKEIDPVLGPLVRYAFERYATGLVSLRSLSRELHERGWMRKDAAAPRVNRLSDVLHNPFYYGLIRIERTNECFQGAHEPLITKNLFDRVQAVFAGKCSTRMVKHDFLFRRLLYCGTCNYRLSGERQKGHVYYRCHTDTCTGSSIREEIMDSCIREQFAFLRLEEEVGDIRDFIAEEMANAQSNRMQQQKALQMQLSKVNERLSRLTDALIDGLIEKDAFDARKTSLLQEQLDIQERIETPSATASVADRVAQYFELGITAYSRYESHNPSEQRITIEKITSNRLVHSKTPAITLKSPFQEIVEARKLPDSGPHRSTLRTRARQIFEIMKATAEREIYEQLPPQSPEVH